MANVSKGFEGLLLRVEEHISDKPRVSNARSKTSASSNTYKAPQSTRVDKPSPKSEVRWGMWVCVIIGGIWLLYAIGNDNKRKIPEYVPEAPYSPPSMAYDNTPPKPVPSYAPSPQPAPQPEEQILKAEEPPVGFGQTLEASQILYCLKVADLLEYIKPRVTSNHQIDLFNHHIGEYNSRCRSYHYYQPAMNRAQREYDKIKSTFPSMGDEILERWRATEPDEKEITEAPKPYYLPAPDVAPAPEVAEPSYKENEQDTTSEEEINKILHPDQADSQNNSGN